jgi:hypothetical protein
MDWLTPTRRVVRWSPFLLAVLVALGTITAHRLADRPLRSVELLMTSAMLVIGALCALNDPARDFVHALPVPASRRLVHRLLVIVPALALALVAVRWLASVSFATLPPAPGWEALTAFGTVGVALCAVLTRQLGARAADAAVSVMVGWLVVAVSSDGLHVPFGVAMPWWRWPLPVAAIAGVVAVVAATSGVEA